MEDVGCVVVMLGAGNLWEYDVLCVGMGDVVCVVVMLCDFDFAGPAQNRRVCRSFGLI